LILFPLVFTKKLFFWIYLWQLKEYHIGRFLDHFQTYKGRSLILNFWLLLKVIVILGIYFSARFGLAEIKTGLVYLIGVIFLAEGLLFLKSLWLGTFKRPVITKKTTVILSSGLSLEVLLMFALLLLEFKITRFTFSFLFLDIIAPLIFSFLVLAYQPLAVFLRNRLIRAAKQKRALFNKLIVIGITGSYGKTSTKEFLATILAERFKVLKTKEHQNSEVGISQCILNELWPEHEVFVCEMGAYNRGGIKLLCGIAKPQIGILTGINEQHMATFGSQENIIKTKYELIEALPQNGTAFFNAQNKYCLDLYNKTNVKKFLYGQTAVSSFEENLAAASAVAESLGMSREEIERGVAKIKMQQASRVKKGANGLNVIDATFSANPTGVIADLNFLSQQPGKKVLVMPCLIELGKASKEVHRRIGRKIAEICDLAIVTTRDRFKEIKEGAGEKAIFMERSDEIIGKIKSFCQAGDTVLLESRVPKRVIDSLIK
jgi:UDP-N-acetylmuramoyl-tripeptide--D-alanyl-D-alanine ligase